MPYITPMAVWPCLWIWRSKTNNSFHWNWFLNVFVECLEVEFRLLNADLFWSG